ncbi:helix-turn-helix domain-containing protein [Brevifollis gellanilyticus]|uniref:helix-turn-helix domain-containing protein n=1 Tax=Brevifollis gellanilyticus TaxID=748831 RepID=UPI0011BF94FB
MHIMNTSNTISPLAYKLKDAATLLGISVITLRRAITRGLIKPSRAFRHVMISADELKRFLNATTADTEKGARGITTL